MIRVRSEQYKVTLAVLSILLHIVLFGCDSDRCTHCTDGGPSRDSGTVIGECEAPGTETWILRYNDVPIIGDSGLSEGNFSVALVLSSDGQIEFLHQSVHSFGGMRMGLEVPARGYFFNYEYETIVGLDNTRIRLTPNDGTPYVFDSSLTDDGPIFEWPQAEDATSLALSDEDFVRVDLPFAFPLMDTTYDHLFVSSNGFVYFGDDLVISDEVNKMPQAFPTNAPAWDAMIAFFWADFDPRGIAQGVTVQTLQKPCQLDCAGVENGFARIDRCGVCAGGETGLTPNKDEDCAGTCFGDAALDRCGSCFGGESGRTENEDDQGCGCFEDAAQMWFEDIDADGLGAGEGVMACRLDVDASYVTNEDDTEPTCSTNDMAECGTCGAKDCSGACDGGAEIDICGGCTGGQTGLPIPRGEDTDGDNIPDACVAPDLIVDALQLASSAYLDTIQIAPDDCYIAEGCVSGSGERRIIRFDTLIANVGNADLAIGTYNLNNPLWEWDQCHDHAHFEHYAEYNLYDLSTGRSLAGRGSKTGFCVLDLAGYIKPESECATYTCADQGITAGCSDLYDAELPCQWMDITGVPPGRYRLDVTTNPTSFFEELDFENNTASITFDLLPDSIEILGFDGPTRSQFE